MTFVCYDWFLPKSCKWLSYPPKTENQMTYGGNLVVLVKSDFGPSQRFLYRVDPLQVLRVWRLSFVTTVLGIVDLRLSDLFQTNEL